MEIITPTNITIAFIGPYSWYPGLTFDGPLVTGGWEQLDIAQYSDFYGINLANYFFWYDFGAALAVQHLNDGTKPILPGAHINIKRFNNYDPNRITDKGVNEKFDSGGFAMTTVKVIEEEHPDVVAIYGDYLVNSAVYTAAVSTLFKLPYINPAAWSYPLLDRNKYGYAVQMNTMFGIGKAISILLKEWNVRRVAVMFPRNSKTWSAAAMEVLQTLESHRVSILAVLDVNMGDDDAGIAYLKIALQRVDARYIIILGDNKKVGQVYYGLSRLQASIGKDYVWIGMNYPIQKSYSSIDNNGKFDASRGFVCLIGFNEWDKFMEEYNAQFLDQVNNITSPSGVFVDSIAAWYVNIPPAYDSIMVLATAFRKLIQHIESGTMLLASRSLQDLMNSTLFESTGYRGMSGSPLQLSKFGDLQSTFNFVSMTGNASTAESITFAFTDVNQTSYITRPGRLPVFYDGSSTPPSDGTKKQHEILISPTEVLGATLIGMISFGLIHAALCLILAIVFRKTKMRQGSTVFQCSICLGSIISFLGQLTYLNRVYDDLCALRALALLGSLAIISSSLIAKTQRIIIIFASKTILPNYLVKDGIYVAMASCLVSVSVLLLNVWNARSHPFATKVQLSETSFMYKCTSKLCDDWTVVLLWIFNGALLLTVGVFGCLTWNVAPKYNQSTSLCAFSILGSILTISSSHVSLSSPYIQHEIQVLSAWCLTTFVLAFEFTPQIWSLLHSNRQLIANPPVTSLSSSRRSIETLNRKRILEANFPVTFKMKDSKNALLWSQWMRASVVVHRVDGEKVHLVFLPNAIGQRAFAFCASKKSIALEFEFLTRLKFDGVLWLLVLDFELEADLANFQNFWKF
ncbi:periplasmic binding protein-like I, partial [Obelidium mucronatum]